MAKQNTNVLLHVSRGFWLIYSLTLLPILQEKPLSRSLQRGEDAQFDQVSMFALRTSRLMRHLASSEPLSPFCFLCQCVISESPVLITVTCLCLIGSCCRSTYNRPVCCRMLFQHCTKPKRIQCYRSICPIVNQEEKMGIECRIAVSLLTTKSVLGTGVYLCDSVRVDKQVPTSLTSSVFIMLHLS